VKENLAKMKNIIHNLGQVLAKEKAAIKKRAYDKIGEFAVQKSALLSEFDSFSSTIENNDANQELLAELNTVRTQAEENAAVLGAISKGVKQARLRLRSLDQSSRTAGVYGPKGGKVNCPDVATISAKV